MVTSAVPSGITVPVSGPSTTTRLRGAALGAFGAFSAFGACAGFGAAAGRGRGDERAGVARGAQVAAQHERSRR